MNWGVQVRPLQGALRRIEKTFKENFSLNDTFGFFVF
jgi:hypothetical protein